MRYPLAPNGVWFAQQGEGHLRGFNMAFVRLAGCSVGCAECDTDWSVSEKVEAHVIADRVDSVTPGVLNDRWVWITGGEPADHNLVPLITALRKKRFSIAVATSGHKRIIPPVDWLSVSPHNLSERVQPYGNELKIVDGLNGMSLENLEPQGPPGFMYYYVQPLWDMGADREDPESLRRCVEFSKANPNWSLSRQDHKHWGVA